MSKLTDWLDRLEERYSPDAIRRREFERKSARYREAAEKALILRGAEAVLNPLKLKEFIFDGSWIHASRTICRYTGGIVGTWDRIKEKNPFSDGELGIWNADFCHGLKRSGALTRHPLYPRRWVIRPAGTRPWLENDLENMPFGRLSRRTDCQHGYSERRLTRCPLMDLHPQNPTGASAMAGLLAGGRILLHKEENWVSLPDNEDVVGLLDDWSIPCSRETVRGRRKVLVSPFFAALLSHHMPEQSASNFIRLTKPGLCPMLPCIYWHRAFGRKYARTMPFPTALPYGCSRSTLTRRGWNRKKLEEIGLGRLGITRVDPRLREVMLTWFQAASREHLTPSLKPSSSKGACFQLGTTG